jgi:hypothetical protein
MTTDEYLELAQFRVNELPAGEYRIGEIFGEYWSSIPNHGALGSAFKGAVQAGKITNLSWIKTGTDNNERYKVG